MKRTHRPQLRGAVTRWADLGDEYGGRLSVAAVAQRGSFSLQRPTRGADAAQRTAAVGGKRASAVSRPRRRGPGLAALPAVLLTLLSALPLRAGEPVEKQASPRGFFRDRVTCVASSRILIRYTLRPDSPAPTQVDLWYTQDKGRHWQKAGLTEAAHPTPGNTAPHWAGWASRWRDFTCRRGRPAKPSEGWRVCKTPVGPASRPDRELPGQAEPDLRPGRR